VGRVNSFIAKMSVDRSAAVSWGWDSVVSIRDAELRHDSAVRKARSGRNAAHDGNKFCGIREVARAGPRHVGGGGRGAAKGEVAGGGLITLRERHAPVSGSGSMLVS
jgi:hypothetical protein